MRLFVAALVLLCTICVQAAASPRKTTLINREWKYAKGDFPEAKNAGYDDSRWENIGLPHSFSIPYFMSKDFYVGYGWYRKHLRLTKAEASRRVYLEFDGVFQEAEIFVNGHPAGSHVGGYTGFSVDITPRVKAGDNVIAVRVNNEWRPDVAPRAGEHVFSGGIYRNVRLVVKEPAHIDWYGLSVSTPDLAREQGQASAVSVQTEVCNEADRKGTYRLQTLVYAPDGKRVAAVETEEEVPAHGRKTFSQMTERLQQPALWSPSTPALYRVVCRLYDGRRLVDEAETTFGFRWFEWTADRGFFLNGRHLDIHGANVHQDQAGWGDAVTEAAMRRDVLMMKEAGFNFIRGSHYPHAPAFSRACDEAGMLFWAEAPFWGIGGFRTDGYWNCSAYPVNAADAAGFEESALRQLAEMIRIHRNHPSIVAWSMCNEAFFSAPEAMPGVRRLLGRMVELSRRLDPTRPAGIGGAQRPLGEGRIDRIGDLAGYNGDGATQPDFQNPGIPNIVSEYGSTTADRPGEYGPGWGDLERDEGWKGREWRSGQVIWCGFDHGSIAGSTLGKMGIVDYFRLPKRAWYWYRNEKTDTPPPAWLTEGVPAQLRLEATKTGDIAADGTDDVQLIVGVQDAAGREISNSPAVTLRIVSGPGEFPTGSSITFAPDSDIRIADGRAAIALRSYHAGQTVVEATSPGLKPARIRLAFTGAPRYKQGVTPAVGERPYTRFVAGDGIRSEQTFGLNNPVFVSSAGEAHVGGMAADGRRDTYWQAEAGDAAPYWLLDTEKGLEFTHISITFPEARCYRYRVEVSADRRNWTPAADCMANTQTESGREVSLSGRRLSGRFVRIIFEPSAEAPAALAEVAVRGIVRQ